MSSTPTNIVAEFYTDPPLYYFSSARADGDLIRRHNAIAHHVPLMSILQRDTRVLDMGCGAGTLSNAIAFHYGSQVVGVDRCMRAVQQTGSQNAEAIDQAARKETLLRPLPPRSRHPCRRSLLDGRLNVVCISTCGSLDHAPVQ